MIVAWTRRTRKKYYKMGKEKRSMSEFILELKDVVKTFGGVTALDGVQFQLKRGEIHALMGENGAGKSTFIKVITGVHQPDSGLMLLEGEKITLRSTEDSAKLGIAAIYQHVTAFPDLSVTENIFMGQEIKTKLGIYNWKLMTKRAKELIEPLSKNIDVSKPMSMLSVAQQQLVEIAKALSRDARILIMDEPTASLSKRECEELYQITEHLRDEGVSIIFITHKFEDMYRLATRVTVFRDSKYIGCWDVDKISNQKLIGAMVGRELTQMYPSKKARIGDTVLRINNISKEGYFKQVSFDVKKGEIVTLIGANGAGKTSTLRAISGLEPIKSGTISYKGSPINKIPAHKIVSLGLSHVPEGRKIFANLTVLENLELGAYLRKDKEIQKDMEMVFSKFPRLKEREKQQAGTLSGGEQQMLAIGRALMNRPEMLILDEPSMGLAPLVVKDIFDTIVEINKSGTTILLVEQNANMALSIADRAYVLETGNIVLSGDAKELLEDDSIKSAYLGE